MANVSIPERYQVGVSRITKLDIETVRAIRAALDAVVYHDRPPKASSVIVTAIGSVSPPEIT
jgi:pyrimidine operon attenuation protein/uracil phosphoribosyltransferase